MLRLTGREHFVGNAGSHKLNDFDQNQNHDYRPKHYVGSKALVAVADRKVSQAAAADGSGHRGIADQVYYCERDSGHNRRHRFRNQDLEDYLPIGASHRAGGLDNLGVNFVKRAFDNAGNKGRGGDA